MRRFGTDLSLEKNQLKKAVVEKLAAAPAEPVEGQIYFDTVLKEFGVYTGSAWVYNATLVEATETVLGGVKLAGDIKGGTGAAPQVTNLHLAGDTAVNHKLTSVTDPTLAQDAATKNYVDNKVNGMSWKLPVVAATTAALPAVTAAGTGAAHTLTANANGILEVDGIKLETLEQRVLVKNQASAKDNGIYTLTTVGTAGVKFVLTRAADASTEAQLTQAAVLVEDGTENADHIFNQITDPPFTVDTGEIVWAEIQGAAAVVGDAIYTTRTGNKIELKPDLTIPALPAEGAVSAGGVGAVRIKRFALKGDGAKLEFTLEHKLGTKQLSVEAQENSAGAPTNPILLDWAPGTNETIIVTFPKAPAAGVSYFVTIIG